MKATIYRSQAPYFLILTAGKRWYVKVEELQPRIEALAAENKTFSFVWVTDNLRSEYEYELKLHQCRNDIDCDGYEAGMKEAGFYQDGNEISSYHWSVKTHDGSIAQFSEAGALDNNSTLREVLAEMIESLEWENNQQKEQEK